jgi:transposase
VYQWQQAWRTGGEAALVPKAVPDRPRKLAEQQRAQLLRLLLQEARANGFPNEL